MGFTVVAGCSDRDVVQSGDLAWTATFASLTSNTSISKEEDILSYGVFFAVAWQVSSSLYVQRDQYPDNSTIQLWASQLVYDLKFFTNDWFHRICFVIQLLVYGALAAFTNKFDGMC